MRGPYKTCVYARQRRRKHLLFLIGKQQAARTLSRTYLDLTAAQVFYEYPLWGNAGFGCYFCSSGRHRAFGFELTPEYQFSETLKMIHGGW